ncbi:MAG: hypothetical protein U0R80_11785 [Nocardioidaceae bacterium]
MTADALLGEADELFALPLDEFTPARDARAKALKKEDAALSAAVKALRKPSLAAWVVNLLVRRETDQVDQVLSVGAALRQAQASLDGAELRELTRQRRQVTSAVTSRARSLAAESGVRVTDSVAEQVEGTLTAAMLDEGAAAAVRSGLLVAALRATGVDAVDAVAALAVPSAAGFAATPRVAPPEARADLHVVPDPEPDERAREEARAALDAAVAAVESVGARVDEARASVSDLQARALQVQGELEELRRRLADLEASAEDTDEELAEAEDELSSVEAEAAQAARVRDEAQAVLDGL